MSVMYAGSRDLRCHRCTKSIVNKSISYVTCDRSFHPGYVKSYLATSSAYECCRRHFVSQSSHDEGLQLSVDGSTTAVSLDVSEPSCHVLGYGSASLHTLLVSVEGLRQQMVDSEARLEAGAEARFSAFAASYMATIDEINCKLSCLSSIAEFVSHFGQRINQLKIENADIT